jgi:hypothetical protein
LRTRVLRSGLCLCVALAALVGAGGCGDDSKDEPTTPANPVAERNGPVPQSLRTVESASEDIIDLALAGKRDEVVTQARKLRTAARGQAARDLEQAGAPQGQLKILKERADRVAQRARSAPLLEVALASNQAFSMVPNFFSRYETPVPASVTLLDYLDFEAKLQSLTGDVKKLLGAIVGLRATWDQLRPQVKDSEVADRFEAHVKAMEKLGNNQQAEQTQREAQHGLDLVDELEQSFAG